MKKQLFTLLTLLVLCVTGAWADATYKDDFNNGQIIWLTTTNIGAAIEAGWMAKNTTAEGSVSSYSTPSSGDNLTVYRVKSWKDKHLDFYVTGVSSITFYAHNPNSSATRTLQATVNETSKEQNAVTLCTINSTESVWGSGTVNLTAGSNNFVRVYADADLDVYAMSVTVPASVPNAPTFLPVSGSTISTSSTITITSTRSTSIKYQWTSDDVTLTTASEGWTDYSAPVAQSTPGTWYLHAYGINATGNSAVSKATYTVSSKTAVSLEFDETSVDATVGGDFTEPTLTVSPNVAAVTDNITYSINAGVTGCTINESTGEITLGSVTGTVAVTATFEGDDDYMPAEASYTINLTSPLTAVGDKTWTFGSTPWTTLTDDGAINYNLTVDNMEILANADNTQKVYSSGSISFDGLGGLTNYFSIGQSRSDSRQLHIKVQPYTRITVYINRGSEPNRLKVTSGSYNGTALINGIELTDGADSYSCTYTGASDADIYIFNSGSNGMNIYAVQVEKLPGGAVEFDYAADGANAASWTKSPIAVSTNATAIDSGNKFIKSWGDGNLTVTLTATSALISNVVLTYQDSGRLPSGITASDNTSLTSDGATQTWTPESTKSSVTFTLTGSPRLTKISVTYNDAVSVTIANSGYSSLGSAYGLDFANATTSTNGATKLTAFAATESSETSVKLVSINEAPAETGVILKGTAGATYTIPVKANAAALTVTNLLHASVTATDIAANTSYIMQGGQFHLVTEDSTVPEGKAYLQATGGAKALTVVFADDVTGIANVNAAEAVQPVKRIVNGQLVIEKNGKRYNAAGAEF